MSTKKSMLLIYQLPVTRQRVQLERDLQVLERPDKFQSFRRAVEFFLFTP